jgi:hypothetical protein
MMKHTLNLLQKGKQTERYVHSEPTYRGNINENWTQISMEANCYLHHAIAWTRWKIYWYIFDRDFWAVKRFQNNIKPIQYSNMASKADRSVCNSYFTPSSSTIIASYNLIFNLSDNTWLPYYQMFPYGVLTNSPWRQFQIIRQIPWFTAFLERLSVIKLTKILPAYEEPGGSSSF